MIWLKKKKKEQRNQCLKDNLVKVILEVQHELHIAETEEQKKIRKNQLLSLIQAAKKYYGSQVTRQVREANILLKDIR